jgi:Pyridoxamine 5'-phosphate oxidase
MAHRMTGDELEQFLGSGTRTGKLATVRADGSPHVAPVWFVLDGGDLIFMTGESTVRAKPFCGTRGWLSQWTTSVLLSHSRSSRALFRSAATSRRCCRGRPQSPAAIWARNWPNSTAVEMRSKGSCSCVSTPTRSQHWLTSPISRRSPTKEAALPLCRTAGQALCRQALFAASFSSLNLRCWARISSWVAPWFGTCGWWCLQRM